MAKRHITRDTDNEPQPPAGSGSSAIPLSSDDLATWTEPSDTYRDGCWECERHKEQVANEKRLRQAMEEFFLAAAPLWDGGDGEGGYVSILFWKMARKHGLPMPKRGW